MENRAHPIIATIGHRFPDAAVEHEALEGSGIQVQCLGELTKEPALQAAVDADAVLLGLGFSLDARALESLRRCRAIVRYGVGVDNVDVAAAAARGMTVSNVPDYGIEEVANHTLSLLLLFARRLDLWQAALKAGQWGGSLPKVKLPRLSKTTLGILGAGRIGRAVLTRALPFWKHILVYDPWVGAKEIQQLGAAKASLDEVLRESDFLTLHVPSTTETKGLLTPEKLALMKQGAILVNCSRGDVIDEAALAKSVIEGHLGGAGLDVFVAEPPASDGIIALGNVWATPHVAYVSVDSSRDLRWKAAEEAARILMGQVPQYVIAMPRGGV